MPIKVGSTDINEIKIGSTDINSVWIGANRVWARGLVVTNGVQSTQGTFFGSSYTNYYRGYVGSVYDSSTSSTTTIGSINRDDIKIDGTYYDLYGCYWYDVIYDDNAFDPMRALSFSVVGNLSASDLTTLTIGNSSFSRTDDEFHAFANNAGYSYWIWRRAEGNGEDLSDLPSPFNSTAGTNYLVTVS